MVSFAFNTMIGQVTPIAMESIGWRFYLLFVVCNFTNALYFWAFQPEVSLILQMRRNITLTTSCRPRDVRLRR